jgi:hypothetical protein
VVSIMPPEPESTTAPRLPLPPWVLDLVAAILESEDTHPKYYQDTALDGYVQLTRCPESRFLAVVLEDVIESARRWAR